MRAQTGLFCLATLFAGAAPLPAAPAGLVLSPDNIVGLRARIGHKVIVGGTVSLVKVDARWGHRTILFDGSELQVSLRKTAYGEGEGWEFLDELPGQRVFIGGEVIDFRGQLKIPLHLPGQVRANPAEINLAAIPLRRQLAPPRGARANTAEPALPGAIVPPFIPAKAFTFSIDRAELLVAMTPLDKLASDPGAPPEIFSVSAVIERAEGIGPAQIAIDPPPEEPSHPLMELSHSMPTKLRGWPVDQVVVISVEADQPPPNVAVAVLIMSLLTGVDVPENIVLCGGLDIDLHMVPTSYPLDPEGGVAKRALALAGDSSAAPLRLIGGPARDSSDFDALRFAGEQERKAIDCVQVIGCREFDELLAVLGMKKRRGLAQILEEFEQSQKVLRERGPEMLEHAEVRKRIGATLRALPWHVSARYYRDLATGKLPPHRSLRASAAALGGLLRHVERRDPRRFTIRSKALREAQAELEQLRPTLHPDAAATAARIDAHFREARPIYSKSSAELDADETEKLGELREAAIALHAEISQLRH